MTNTGVSAVEKAIQTFDIWLRDIDKVLGWNDREKTYRALRAILHALRDHLTVEEAAQLSAQLPTLIRGIYWEGWRPTGKPSRNRRLQDFLDGIDSELGNDPTIDPMEVACAVHGVLSAHVSSGEMRDVTQSLPKGIREIFTPTMI